MQLYKTFFTAVNQVSELFLKIGMPHFIFICKPLDRLNASLPFWEKKIRGFSLSYQFDWKVETLISENPVTVLLTLPIIFSLTIIEGGGGGALVITTINNSPQNQAAWGQKQSLQPFYRILAQFKFQQFIITNYFR